MSAGVRIIMFGRQGAGKGTQSARLAKYFDVPHISTGEMLRNAVKQDSVVGRSAKAVLDRGELVDDDLMVSLVQGRIGQEDARTAGFVLDGFPRTIGQATAFDALTQMRPVGFVVTSMLHAKLLSVGFHRGELANGAMRFIRRLVKSRTHGSAKSVAGQ